MSWAFFARVLKFLPQNGLKMAKSQPSRLYGKPWKTQILRKLWFLKAVVVLGWPKWILGEFRIFLKNFWFFFNFSPLLGHILQEFWNFRLKMSPKWPNLVYGKPWKTQIFRKFCFREDVVILGCPKCILGKFRIFLKTFKNFFSIFD